MSLALTSPVTGAAISGLTSPTYSLLPDIAPEPNALQYVVSTIGGTQVGVLANSVSYPFTINLSRPKVLKQLPEPNAVTGKVTNIPRNVYRGNVRKSLAVTGINATQRSNGIFRWELDLPAGADVNDVNSVLALVSSAIGVLTQVKDGLASTAITGTL